MNIKLWISVKKGIEKEVLTNDSGVSICICLIMKQCGILIIDPVLRMNCS